MHLVTFKLTWIFLSVFVIAGHCHQLQSLYNYDQLVGLSADQIYSYTKELELDNTIEREAYISYLHGILDQPGISNNPVLQAIMYHRLGKQFVIQDHAKAATLFESGINIAKANDLTFIHAKILVSYGHLMNRVEKKDQALVMFLESFHLYKEVNIEEAASMQYNIANLQFAVKNYNEVIQHGHLAKSLYNKKPYDSLSAAGKTNYMSLMNTLGLAYSLLGKYDSALYYFNRSYDLAENTKDRFWKALINGNISKIYIKKRDYDTAIMLLKKDYSVSKEFNEWGSVAASALLLSEIYFKQDNLSTAKEYIDSANQVILSKKIRSQNINRAQLEYLRQLSRWYEAKKEFEKAHKWQKEYMILKDSLVEIQNALNLSKVRAGYELDSKLAEIELLKENSDLQKSAIQKRNIIIGGSVLVIILIITMSIYLYRSLRNNRLANILLHRNQKHIANQNKELAMQGELLAKKNKTIQSINDNLELKVQKRTKKLREINEELDTFLYRASHDTRQPIATILGLANLARNQSSDEKMYDILDHLNTTAHGMDTMLSKLRMLYTLNHQKNEKEQVDIKGIFEEVFKGYKGAIKKRGIEIVNLVGESFIITNRDLLTVIIRNIIENSITFSHDERPAFIKVSVQHQNNHLVTTVADNGYGIESKYVAHIFNAYFKGSERSLGNGLGLYLAKKAADILNINITVASTPNGTQFSLQIPLNKQ